MVLNGVKIITESAKYSKKMWVGRGKGKRLFRRLGFCAVPRGFKNLERKGPECEPAQRFAREALDWKIFELPQEHGRTSRCPS